MYEVATFLRHRGSGSQPAKPVVFLPVQVSILYLITIIANSVLHCSTLTAAATWRYEDQSFGAMAWFITCNSTVPWIFLPACFHLCTAMLNDAAKLRGQLQSFRIQDSMCFCCQHGHQHPETGFDIPCDRQLIYGVLQKWFGSSVHSQQDCLDVFNRVVQDELAPPVLRKLLAGGQQGIREYITRGPFRDYTPLCPTITPIYT